MSTKPYIRVAVGVILAPNGEVLLGDRPADKPWPAWWELPGGKIEAHESVTEALIRELDEELGIQSTQLTPWVKFVHEYPRNFVELNFYKVTAWQSQPSSREGQRLDWLDVHAPTPLHIGPLLPASLPVLEWLRLPPQYLISAIDSPDSSKQWLQRLEHALEQGVRLVQLREPYWEQQHPNDPDLYAIFQQSIALCHHYKARCLINSVHPTDWWHMADGVHLRSQDAARLVQQDNPWQQAKPHLVAVSVHNQDDIRHAQQLNSDFVVIGHVLDTPSHPHEPALDWDAFLALAQQAGRPAYAIGGQSPATLSTAQQHGAHGIAGIRHLLHDDKQHG